MSDEEYQENKSDERSLVYSSRGGYPYMTLKEGYMDEQFDRVGDGR